MEFVASLSQGRTAAAQCGLFTHKSVPVIFEPPCISGKTSVVSYNKPRELFSEPAQVYRIKILLFDTSIIQADRSKTVMATRL